MDTPSLGCALQWPDMASLAVGIILAVLAPLIITANVLVAIALLRLIWKTGYKGHYFVLNLAAADALVGLSVAGLIRDELFERSHPPHMFCVLRMAFVTTSSAASILSLTLVACYRHLAIRKPFHCVLSYILTLVVLSLSQAACSPLVAI